MRIWYSGFTDNPTWAEYKPLEFHLDGLSLRIRVVKAFLKFDKPHARKLFIDKIGSEIDLPPLGCENAARYYYVSEFYGLALTIFNETYTAKERRDPAFLYAVLPYIDQITSPAQVDPVAKMIADLKPTPSQLTFLTASFTQALSKVQNDDLTLRDSLSETVGITSLFKTVAAIQPETSQQFNNAFRAYILRANERRCSDGVKKSVAGPTESKYELPEVVEMLNRNRILTTPIRAEEIVPERITKTIWPPHYWEENPRAAERLDAVRKLRFKYSEGQEYSSEDDKLIADWQIKFDKFLLDLGEWSASEEKTQENYLNKKSIMFWGLIEDIAPRGKA